MGDRKFAVDKGGIKGEPTDDLFGEQNTCHHNGVEFITLELASRIRGVTYGTIHRWIGSGLLTKYRPQGRRVWLRRDEVEALTPPSGEIRSRISPEARKTALRADLSTGEAAFLSGLTPEQVHGIRVRAKQR